MKKTYLLILLVLLVSLALFFLRRTPSGPASPLPSSGITSPPILSFAVIGDPESDLENLKKALNKALEQKLKFIVIVGDLTNTGTPSQFEDFKNLLGKLGKLGKLEIKVYLIPGNHDLWYFKQTSHNVYKQYFGDNYYVKKIGDYQFLFLDNSDEQLGFSQLQLTWLSQQLEQWNNETMEQLIFSHIPFYHPESPRIMGEYNQAVKTQAQDLLDKFCQNPPLAIFSGHLHHTEDYEYECKNGRKLRMINAGSVNDKRNWQLPRFLKIDIYEDQTLQVEEIEL